MEERNKQPVREPGGGRFLTIVAFIVITSLLGILWSLLGHGKISGGAPPGPPAAQSSSR
ncbi:hypothetical protein [Denitratisoma oestradiolicum]|uniref:Uncharacterized protein n=1 Tax=Denitratisoma oestradiolicum TaxID=311182 RepID=A0A6S6Y0M0_9PROT|nr:hypothetical protein [Denitratisoma oestradiolicum]CAB1370938.1 conserved protein of unknown function [Denitratisoma oestradiolicum]